YTQIAIDFAPLRILTCQTDARQLQRSRVRDSDVSIHALQKNRVIRSDLINVPAAGQFFHRPQGVIPSAAGDPFARLGGLYPRANTIAKFGQRFDARQVNREPPEACASEMEMGIVESRHDE